MAASSSNFKIDDMMYMTFNHLLVVEKKKISADISLYFEMYASCQCNHDAVSFQIFKLTAVMMAADSAIVVS